MGDYQARMRLAPRVRALLEDVRVEQLSRGWREKVEALHAQVTALTSLAENAPAARRLLHDIRSFRGFEDDVQNVNLYREWRRQLSWYTAPVPPPSAADATRAVEAMEAQLFKGHHDTTTGLTAGRLSTAGATGGDWPCPSSSRRKSAARTSPAA